MADFYSYMSRVKDFRAARAHEYDLLLLRLDLLEPEEKTLIELYLKHELTVKQLAQLSGMNRGTVYRRITRLCEKLLAGGYITVLRNREQFEREELKVAYDRFLLGLGCRAIARKRNLGPRQTERIVKKLEEAVISMG